jgi:iron complex transport system substrate-binding protein
MQAEIVKNLTLQGHHLVLFNQRSIKEILQNILVIGSIIDKKRESEKLVNKYEKRLEAISKKSGELKYRPKVYFEEWFEPMISGICWVSELIEISGGDDIFPELRNKKNGKERIVTSEKVIKRNPDIIIGSWCGKQFKKNQVKKRGGWDKISAVKNKKLYEIKSSIILQPGPAALTEGLDKLVKLTHSY